MQGNGTGAQDWYNLNGERSISEMDVSRSLTMSYVAELPFGQGRRFFKANRVADKVIGSGNRPNSTGNSAKLSGDRSRNDQISRWFDTTAFTLPASFTMGNVSRTLPDTRGPGVTNIDFSLVKNLAVVEKVNLQIRAEAFNAFNRPQFWMPNTAFGSLDFGRITASQQTVLPRVMQFALKLAF